MQRIPQPIPYQGSKRNIAQEILAHLPDTVTRLVEPFAGSAALSISAAALRRAETFWLNDLNAPLVRLLEMIVDDPRSIADRYEELWRQQIGREKRFYAEVRGDFNATHEPVLLLYLLARCVKASVRYNSQGEFNQGPDNRRRGRQPAAMRADIAQVSALLKGRTKFTSLDYSEMADLVNSETDVLYLDPPYQGTSTHRDPRYFKSLDVTELIRFLLHLNRRGVRYALSYDGHKGGKQYGIALPDELGLNRIEINAGRSSQSTLLGHSHVTYESLYLSPALVVQLRDEPPSMPLQPELLRL